MRRAALVSLALVLVVLLAGCSVLVDDGLPDGDELDRETTTVGADGETTAGADAATQRNASETIDALLSDRYSRDPYRFVLERRTVYESGTRIVVWMEGHVDTWGHVLMEGYVLTDNGSSQTRLTRRMYITPIAGSDEWKIYDSRGENNSICTTDRFNYSRERSSLPVRFAYPNVTTTFQWRAAGTDGAVRTFEADALTERGRERTAVEFDSVSATLRLNTETPRVESYRFEAAVTRNGSRVRLQENWTRTAFGYRRSKELRPSWIHTGC